MSKKARTPESDGTASVSKLGLDVTFCNARGLANKT